jgi:hypothetical protein
MISLRTKLFHIHTELYLYVSKRSVCTVVPMHSQSG